MTPERKTTYWGEAIRDADGVWWYGAQTDAEQLASITIIDAMWRGWMIDRQAALLRGDRCGT